jgi:metal-responsive CopG/Arc/MetJ family transcriptional regulator
MTKRSCYKSFEEDIEIARLLEGIASRKGTQRSSIIREAVRRLLREDGVLSDEIKVRSESL